MFRMAVQSTLAAAASLWIGCLLSRLPEKYVRMATGMAVGVTMGSVFFTDLPAALEASGALTVLPALFLGQILQIFAGSAGGKNFAFAAALLLWSFGISAAALTGLLAGPWMILAGVCLALWGVCLKQKIFLLCVLPFLWCFPLSARLSGCLLAIGSGALLGAALRQREVYGSGVMAGIVIGLLL